MQKHCFVAFFFICAVTAGHAQISNDSLVLFLPFNGNANDISGNNYNGIVGGAVLVPGFNNLPNSAYQFDGAGSIVIPNIAKLDGQITTFTILIRLKAEIAPGGINTSYTFLSWQRNSQDQATAFLEGKVRMGWEPPGNAVGFTDDFMDYIATWCSGNVSTASGYEIDSSLVNNKWHTIALVYDAGTLKVYHNCDIKNDWEGVYPRVSDLCGTDPMEIVLGSSPASTAQYGYKNFIGSIDELRIYKRALSEGEVDYFADSLCNQRPPPQVLPSIYYTVNPCQPNQLTFIDTSTVKGTALTKRVWQISDGDSATASQFTYTFTKTGNYHVQLNLYADSTIYSTDTVVGITSIAAPRFLKTGQQNFQACAGASIELNVSGGQSYSWLPCTGLSNCNTASVTAHADTNTMYTVTGKDYNNCADTLHINLVAIADNNKVFAPNAFTPNADGYNDTWGILSEKPLAGFNLVIFNRWGQPIFSSNNQGAKWDGSEKSTTATPGTYVWVLKYENANGCKQRVTKGTVTLIR